ncbi:hypothetical protein FPQ18DRAFT_310237 [Pyronema domesticum]|nr:hypothetical protein FPQ18DRAFT_310237 [Pyronema domesticum]
MFGRVISIADHWVLSYAGYIRTESGIQPYSTGQVIGRVILAHFLARHVFLADLWMPCAKDNPSKAFLYSDTSHEALAGLIRHTKIGTRLERQEKEAETAGAAIAEDAEEVDSEDEEGEEDDVEHERREAALAEAMTWPAEQFGDELA